MAGALDHMALCQSSWVVLKVSGHSSRYKREEELADLPDVGFISNKPTRRQTRPVSEAFPERAPYSSRRKAQRRSLQLSYSGSSTDEDERTNRAVEAKRGGTFSVGLASRTVEQKEAAGGSDSDHEETCEYCAAEKVCKIGIVNYFKTKFDRNRAISAFNGQKPCTTILFRYFYIL